MTFLLDFLFPRTCLGCGKTGQYFCSSCIRKIRVIESQICPVCEKPSPFGQTHSACQTRNSLDGLVSFFIYEGIIKKAIHQLKFKYVTDLADELFSLLKEIWMMEKADRFSQMKCFIETKKPVIVSVPLYWYKENLRGFNQTEIFGKKFAQLWNLQFRKDILIRSKSTQSQVGLTEEERQKNIANAFSISPSILISQYPDILLIDDIWTTGATLKTCGALLKKTGAKEVWGLTIAR